MQDSSFDPAKHLTKVSGKDYLEVKWRLVWLRNDYPDAKIITSLVSHTQNQAVFSAQVELPGGAIATGHGSETPDDFGDYLEKAETKAVGRALAMLGYGTQFAPEIEEGTRIVDSPVQRQAPRQQTAQMQSGPTHTAPSNGNGGGQVSVSDKQLGFMKGLMNQAGWHDAAGELGMKDGFDLLNEYTKSVYQCTVYELTGGRGGQASEVIEWLKGSPDFQSTYDAYVTVPF